MAKNIFQSKKADERYLSPWMFLIWAIIGVSIIIGVIQFYSVIVDSRALEASILNTRIMDCVSQEFNYAKISNPNFDVYGACNLNKEVLESKNDYYYFNLSVKDSSGKFVYSIVKGVGKFEVLCSYEQTEQNFAQCSKKSISVQDVADGKKYTLYLVTASNQR